VISRNVGLAKSGVKTLNFGRANFKLFKELLAKISSDVVPKDKDVEESWLLFQDAFLRAQPSPSIRIRNQANEEGNQHG